MTDHAEEAAPARTATVRLLDTIEPTATDKTRYDAGTDWTFTEDRALALVDEGKAELLSDTPSAAPAPAPSVDADEEN